MSGPTRNEIPFGAGDIASDRRALLAGLGALGGMAVGSLLARRAAAGPLDPPAGAISPTYKTLTEVEPRVAVNQANTPGGGSSVYRITRAGSYYLTDNLRGSSGRITLEIAADNVSVDLMGFTIEGAAGSILGVSSFVAVNNLAIRNGFITGPGDGIAMGVVAVGYGGIIENVHAYSTGGVGIGGNGNMVIRNCSATSCPSSGIFGSDNCVIENCSARSCSRGILAGTSCQVRNCSANLCGADGIFVGNRTSVTDCMTLQCGNGIQMGTGGIVRGNFCAFSTNGAGNAAGIFLGGFDCRVEENACTSSNRGIRAIGTGNFIARNVCSGNTINWDITTGNAVAPIVIATTNGALISGNTYAGGLGSTDARANFTY